MLCRQDQQLGALRVRQLYVRVVWRRRGLLRLSRRRPHCFPPSHPGERKLGVPLVRVVHPWLDTSGAHRPTKARILVRNLGSPWDQNGLERVSLVSLCIVVYAFYTIYDMQHAT